MVSKGKINKLSKGKYYKPEKTAFGDLVPEQYQVVKDLLEVNGKTIGYLTGYSIFNQLGLTTQVGNTIQIGKNETRPSHQRGRYTISYLKQKNTITKSNIPLLQLLDMIYLVKKIPDTTPNLACKRFLNLIQPLSSEEESTLVRLAQKYAPNTRALLGALLEQLDRNTHLNNLQKSLNPITKYKMKGVDDILTHASKWNIQ